MCQAVTRELPGIISMVKVATNQVKWPFYQDDAFMLTDIQYSGTVIDDNKVCLRDSFLQESYLFTVQIVFHD
jgi:hypothetical protein